MFRLFPSGIVLSGRPTGRARALLLEVNITFVETGIIIPKNPPPPPKNPQKPPNRPKKMKKKGG